MFSLIWKKKQKTDKSTVLFTSCSLIRYCYEYGQRNKIYNFYNYVLNIRDALFWKDYYNTVYINNTNYFKSILCYHSRFSKIFQTQSANI